MRTWPSTWIQPNDHARLCKNLACKTCLARARDMSLFLRTILHQFLQKMCKLAGNYSCSISRKILHHFLQDMCKYRARIVQEKGHIACTYQASLACKIFALSCIILQVRFCWASGSHQSCSSLFKRYKHLGDKPPLLLQAPPLAWYLAARYRHLGDKPLLLLQAPPLAWYLAASNSL